MAQTFCQAMMIVSALAIPASGLRLTLPWMARSAKF
jgi:hypothetical protein